MLEFRKINSENSVLAEAPLVRALDFLTFKFDQFPKGIPLTKGMSLKRDLVAEAIAQVQWPDWTEERIYGGFAPIKVADEYHFLPFLTLRHHLLDLKICRHYKGKLLLSTKGKALFSDRFRRFDTLAKYIMLEDPHISWLRYEYQVFGNWDIWLNVLDYEITHGASGQQITDALFGKLEPPDEFDPRTSRFRSTVLEPLISCGLVHESIENGRKLTERIYRKTPLWGQYLKLDPKRPMLHVVH